MSDPAGLERRCQAFAIDRLVASAACAAGAALVWGPPLAAASPGVRLLLTGLVVLVVELALAVPLGLRGTSPGKAARGLRLVRAVPTDGTGGDPVGLPCALLRSGILLLAVLPTAGLGAAALAWTCASDLTGRRRGWHDHLTGGVVVVARAPAARTGSPEEAGPPASAAPGALVNLTALRLAPGPAAAPPAWRVAPDAGQEVVVAGAALVGRRPEPRPGEQVRHLVRLDPADWSVSKTHARLDVDPAGRLVVVDRGSTNGSVLVREGASSALAAGRPTVLRPGDRVVLGDRGMRVLREA